MVLLSLSAGSTGPHSTKCLVFDFKGNRIGLSFAQLPLCEQNCYFQHGSKEDTTPKCSLCHFVVSKLPYCHTHTLDIQYFVVLLLPVCIERDAADFVQHCRCNSSSAPQIIFPLSGKYIFRILFVHENNFFRPLSANSVINDWTVSIVKFVVPSHSEGWIFIQLLNFIKSYFTRLNPSTHVKNHVLHKN